MSEELKSDQVEVKTNDNEILKETTVNELTVQEEEPIDSTSVVQLLPHKEDEGEEEEEVEDKIDLQDENSDSKVINNDSTEEIKNEENTSVKDEEGEDKKNQPAFIPRKGKFYEHDDRLGDEVEGGADTVESVEK